ncbi:unnamed protein product [Lampetra fluviatilis]
MCARNATQSAARADRALPCAQRDAFRRGGQAIPCKREGRAAWCHRSPECRGKDRLASRRQYLQRLKALGVTIKQCHEEVGLLLLFFSVGVSIFSVLEYALESSCPGTGFTSVPSAWWWATTSMTTVGYGDVRPDTTAGKLAAFACILSGLLVLALPIAIINDKFAAFYRALRLRDAAERHGRALRGLARAQEDGDADGDAGPRANLRDAYARHVLGALRGRGDRHSVERL